MYAIEQLMTVGSREKIEKAAGATIHYVDSGIDTGRIIKFKKIKSLWSLPSIWAVKGESYLLAFDLMSDYLNIHFVFQVASLLAALVHPSHIVIYAPGDLLPCRRDAS